MFQSDNSEIVQKSTIGGNIKRACVVIPIYKDKIDTNEQVSLQRMLEVFKDEEIVVITYKGLALPTITSMLMNNANYRFEYFSKFYFETVDRYNQLMLSKCFYDRFRDYEYILISQLDVYVFSNQLEYWCNKGFDFIGAPLFKHNSKDFGNCFNGGFSLRKVSSFIRKYDSYKEWVNFLCKPYHISIRFIIGVLFSLVTFFNIKIQIPKTTSGEDTIWSRLGKIPTFEESAAFSFEKYLSYLYSIINHYPFGCHAYIKWNDGFYEKCIVIK